MLEESIKVERARQEQQRRAQEAELLTHQQLREQVLSLFLLCWYKSTNTDALLSSARVCSTRYKCMRPLTLLRESERARECESERACMLADQYPERGYLLTSTKVRMLTSGRRYQ